MSVIYIVYAIVIRDCPEGRFRDTTFVSGASDTITLSIGPRHRHGATACMGDILTGMLGHDGDSTSQSRRQDYTSTYTFS